jgi:hypothetical protein
LRSVDRREGDTQLGKEIFPCSECSSREADILLNWLALDYDSDSDLFFNRRYHQVSLHIGEHIQVARVDGLKMERDAATEVVDRAVSGSNEEISRHV